LLYIAFYFIDSIAYTITIDNGTQIKCRTDEEDSNTSRAGEQEHRRREK
jgi:hypothetical protein